MKYSLHISSLAERDIDEAANYIENVLKNPQAAEALLDEIEETLHTLREYPERIPLVSEPVLKAWGIRFIRIKNYLVFFTVDNDRNRVTIVRFQYAKRNWWTILKGSLLQ